MRVNQTILIILFYFILSWIEFFSIIIYRSLFKLDLESGYSNLLIAHHPRLKIEEQDERSNKLIVILIKEENTSNST